MMTLHVEPLTREAYASFGELLWAGPSSAVGDRANQGTASKFGFLTPLENARPESKPNVSVFRVKPVLTFPLPIKMLERHPHSTQMFIPMNASRYLVVVANGVVAPDLSTLRAFLADSNMGITYRPHTWHHPLLALDHTTDFAGLVYEDGTVADCTIVRMTQAIQVASLG